jgi:hypothetical protein
MEGQSALDGKAWWFQCPNCGTGIIVLKSEMNCEKFICGQFKDGTLMNPHLSKLEVERLKKLSSSSYHGCLTPLEFDGKKLVIRNYG